MCLFINGLPVITFELKNQLTKQNTDDAVQQYRDDRDPRDLLFSFKRCMVHFAVDDACIKFCTKLAGKDSWFLPFDKGYKDGAGNPPNPSGMMTDYLWKDILTKAKLTGIIENYAQVIQETDPDTKKKSVKQVFPRYHQLDVVEKLLADVRENGIGKKYLIQHSAGSGKSNSIAWLAHQLIGLERDGHPMIDSVIVVTDRRILDKQIRDTIKQFMQVRNTVVWAEHSGDLTDAITKGKRIIITTIQKLANFIGKNPKHPVYDAHVVIIFDECHRSQFGDMHKDITNAFKRYHLFGFTGTPIFSENAPGGSKALLCTTEKAFGDKLHTYTIVDAINDKNVLPFRVDYINTIKASEHIRDKQVSSIDTEQALLAPERITQIVAYIREHFDQKTRRTTFYSHKDKRLSGFNSLFATASIEAAKRYYLEFSNQQKDMPPARRLKVGLIYSFAANEETADGALSEEECSAEGLDASSRDFLENIIKDYNQMFSTSFDTSADKFQNYYKDLSLRLKSRELDVVIVVNMFLAGFDATTLNTLWVDKNLRAHGLIQAFSRTNRILNSVKTYGNIVSFRNLEQETNDALALFGNKDAKNIALLKSYTEYYAEYKKQVKAMLAFFPLDAPITGETAQKDFIRLFGSILRLKNILVAFDDFTENDILSGKTFQDYQSQYLNLHAEFRRKAEAEREAINDDVVFEIELIKQVEINVDYILMLVETYLKKKGSEEGREIRSSIARAVNSSPSLRNKKDLIEQFVDSVSITEKVDEAWLAYIKTKKEEELERIIAEEKLNPAETKTFVANAFRDGAIPTTGTAITKILPPVSRFSKNNNHAAKKQSVLDKLRVFFERFFGLS